VQTPEPFPPAEQEPFYEPEEEVFARPAATGFWALGGRLAWVAVAREFGFELPPSVPESLVVIALGSLATIFVLIRLISIPDSIPPPAGRGIGIWISLLASLAVIVAGLLRASEEL
jgi:hypothetical protein